MLTNYIFNTLRSQLRKGLVIFQFVITISLISSISKQHSTPTDAMSAVRSDHFRHIAATVNIDAYDDLHEQVKNIWHEYIHDIPFESIFFERECETRYTA